MLRPVNYFMRIFYWIILLIVFATEDARASSTYSEADDSAIEPDVGFI
ncbi:MAG: hypothetical protein UT66_C0035G0006 [candidate division CPR2 bacterium GW2011_GWC1_39_9]|uniref:Uncharacterized protein n=1 Tax=candidate division CPR2 bacterium GW2011_GWC2_39_10 TaxID=1618345 RepID=A0A0G0P6I6_UNCC2|nr:MAG: hypothetical protein UT18_C0016G0020 [candidate division CPR2 bacterium GW2011_GWC2_39_10]KKR33673.1 MAG: hypothetical protein UT66_C0035G0006 [candidate division CPR2 bacterium GW2011_GWC1_39_9]